MQYFKILLFGLALSNIGSSVTSFSISLWVMKQTQSSFDFSLVMLAAGLPVLLTAPVLGAISDKFKKLSLMMLCQTICICSALVLLALFFLGLVNMALLVIVTVVMGIASALSGLAFVSLIPLLVGTSKLHTAQAFRASLGSIISLITPVIGGILLYQLNLGVILLLDAISYLFALASIQIVRIEKQEQSPASSSALLNIMGLKAFIAELSALPVIKRIFVKSIMVNFVSSSLLVVIPFYFLSSFPYSQAIALMVAGSIGALVGSILISKFASDINKIPTYTNTVLLVMAAAYALIAIPNVINVFIGMVVLSASFSLFNGMVTVSIQVNTNVENRGRMFAYLGMAAQSASLLALPVYGLLMDQSGFVSPNINSLSGFKALSESGPLLSASYASIASVILIAAGIATFAIWVVFRLKTPAISIHSLPQGEK
ncbi:MFS transporter [Alteromonas sp. BMJM2]|uniref:MFS transporter n=1 Tax=Alteromonas sp. BMJM2 TaxID=2954241 RepID=UPI0022B59965|nr:MFS transporter [Alteromonas sp. BMJM2]